MIALVMTAHVKLIGLSKFSAIKTLNHISVFIEKHKSTFLGWPRIVSNLNLCPWYLAHRFGLFL